MRAASGSANRVSDILLALCVVIVAAGLAVQSSGVHDLADSCSIAAADARLRWNSGRDPDRHSAALGGARTAGSMMLQTATVDAFLQSVPRSPHLTFTDGLGTLDGLALERAAVRWSGEVHPFFLVDDRRGYLARMASAQWIARWYRSLATWEAVTGYGALEASRAARDPDASAAASRPTAGGPGPSPLRWVRYGSRR